MSAGDVHTVHRDDAWINEIEGQAQEAGGFSSKEDAVKAGRGLAKRLEVEHVIHDEHEDLSG